MGLRGKPPTPTPILKARGSRWANGREGEPVPPPGRPPCPVFLAGEAKREWHRTTKALDRMGILARCDVAVLASYCQAWAQFAELTAKLNETRPGVNGELVRTFGVGTKEWRFVAAAQRETVDQIIRLAGQLGLSPSARTRIRAADQTKDGGDSVSGFARPRGQEAG